MSPKRHAKALSSRRYKRQRISCKRQLRPIVHGIETLRALVESRPNTPALPQEALEPFFHLVGLIMRLVSCNGESPVNKVRSVHRFATDAIFKPRHEVQDRFVAFVASIDPEHPILSVLRKKTEEGVEGDRKAEIQQGEQPVSSLTSNGKYHTYKRYSVSSG